MTDEERLIEAMTDARYEIFPSGSNRGSVARASVRKNSIALIQGLRKRGVILTPPPEPEFEYTITLTDREAKRLISAIKCEAWDDNAQEWISGEHRDLYWRLISLQPDKEDAGVK